MNTLKKILIVLALVVITISACSPQSEITSVPPTPAITPENETASVPSTPSNSPQNETTRDLSTPSKIIVGHWMSPIGQINPPTHFYFGNFDENGNARCFYNEVLEEELRPSTCRIYKETEKTLWIQIMTEDEEKLHQFPFTPADDGKTMVFDDDVPLVYIDTNTEP